MDTTTRSSRRLLPIATLVVGLAAWLGGCAPTYTDYAAFVKEPRPEVTSTDYRIGPPDAITIQSKRVREINGQTATVAPDGTVMLPLLGRIHVAGKSPEELSAQLSYMARDYYEDADVTVSVARFASKKIFIFGEVAAPGPYPYFGANTVLETMSRAQPTRLADPEKIQILRPSPDGAVRKRMTIDLNKMVKEGDTTLDAVLEEGDILYIPPNPLAKVGLAFQQLLLPIQPIAQTVRAPSDIYDDTAAPGAYQTEND
ncbi:MAG: polysaccharide biosynthesis/export family protein [Planctomycetota bacterium]